MFTVSAIARILNRRSDRIKLATFSTFSSVEGRPGRESSSTSCRPSLKRNENLLTRKNFLSGNEQNTENTSRIGLPYFIIGRIHYSKSVPLPQPPGPGPVLGHGSNSHGSPNHQIVPDPTINFLPLVAAVKLSIVDRSSVIKKLGSTAVDADNLFTEPNKADKDVLEFIQSSKNIIDADFEDETEMNNAVPTSKSGKS
ncbi:hypothetical protein TNCV_4002221 [Trichonephila clavipes]|uniref:Uncharacterized protein n=1 Tax=Trichonephila clavipes TaxID=2585209 RepID=A0A8X6RP81_TRICX|nr:hypothetical protein TNCV_4002221 [Trichonephila clavipes]